MVESTLQTHGNVGLVGWKILEAVGQPTYPSMRNSLEGGRRRYQPYLQPRKRNLPLHLTMRVG